MIIGVGTDIVDIERIHKMLDKHEARFLKRVMTTAEIKTAQNIKERQNFVMHVAKRFAAKEACAKALGTGFRNGIAMIDFIISNNERGKPIVHLDGEAQAFCIKNYGSLDTINIQLSLSDEKDYAQAFVVIESL